MDKELKGMIWVALGATLLALFILICAPALGIHLPIMK